MKKALFYGFLFLLFIPLLKQSGVIPINDIHLDNIDGPHSYTRFTFSNWLNNDFQTDAEAALNDRAGFRGVLVRLNNQVDFSLFNTAHADKAIVTDDKILFDEWYLDAWQGRTFVGEEFIDIKLWKLKMIQDTLRKLGTPLVFVMAPNKVHFFEDKIPGAWADNKLPRNNYTYLKKRLAEIEIDHIDLNEYFLQIKDTSQCPLYPQSGIHWSYYGGFVALDTLLRTIGQKLDTNLNEVVVDSVVRTKNLRHPDNDIGININLLCDPPAWELCYPQFHLEENPGNIKPRVLVAGDSYYFNIFNYDLSPGLFSKHAFWYYAQLVYPEYYSNKLTADHLNWRREIESMDVIFVMVTLRFMHIVDWAFIDNTFYYFFPEFQWNDHYSHFVNAMFEINLVYALVETAEKQGIPFRKALYSYTDSLVKSEEPRLMKSVSDYRNMIRSDSVLIQNLRKEAQSSSMQLKDIVYKEAIERYTRYWKAVNKTLRSMKNYEPWMEEIRNKAAINEVSIEQQMIDDAEYLFEQEQQQSDKN